MLHKFLGLPTLTLLLLLLLLLIAQFPMPTLCAQGRLPRHRRLHAHHHQQQQQQQQQLHAPQSASLHADPSNNNINIRMVIGKEESLASGHKANMNIQVPGHKSNVMMRAPVFKTANANIGVPPQVAHSMNRMAPHEAHVAPLSKLTKRRCSIVAASGQNPTYHASLAKRYVVPSLRRSLVTNHVSASDSNHDLQNGEELSLSLVGLSAAKVHNIFGMLPRAHHVPPSGPSKSHNSEVTEKSS